MIIIFFLKYPTCSTFCQALAVSSHVLFRLSEAPGLPNWSPICVSLVIPVSSLSQVRSGQVGMDPHGSLKMKSLNVVVFLFQQDSLMTAHLAEVIQVLTRLYAL